MASRYKKKGQVTLFILIALMLVALILVLFYLRGIKTESQSFDESGIFLNLKACAQEAVKDELKILYEKGWVLNARNNISYRGVPFTYLCYTTDYGMPCYNRYPMLEESVEATLREETKDELNDCFSTLKSDLESRGYTVNGNKTDYSIDILPGLIKIVLKKPITLTKETVKREVSNFDTDVVSSAYELLHITREIVNGEATTCVFPRTAFSFLYPQYQLDRTFYQDSRLYEITYLPTMEKFKFAIRGCVTR